MSVLGVRLAKLGDRLYDRLRAPAAFTAARTEPTASGFGALRGCKYCLLVTFRRSGEPVPTPVWFGLDADGRMYVFTGASSAKVKRIRADPRVRVAPATVRGEPTGPLAPGTARVLAPEDAERAERALKANYGLGRKLYDGMLTPALGVDMVYLEVTAAATGAAEAGGSGGESA